MKKAIAFILAVFMTVSLFGCGATPPATSSSPSTEPSSTASTEPSAPPAESAATESAEPAEPEYFKKYDPIVTFTQNQVVGSDAKWLPGDSVESSPYTEWMEKTLGIKFEASWVSADWDSNDQKLNIAAASNSLPDVIFTRTDTIAKLIKAEQVMPLDDLINQYASPLVKYLNDVNVESTRGKFQLPYVSGGKTYAYAFPYDNAGLWKVSWIRKDLLDEVGKSVPQTLQDLEDVMIAYLAKHPDGSALPLNKDLDLEIVMSAFAAYPGQWQMDDSGNLVYGSIQPGVRQGLEVLNRWYNAGYIDKEFIAKTGDQTMATFTKGDMLTWKGAWWSVHWPFPDLWKNNPAGAEMVVMPVLKGPDGKQGIMVSAVSGMGVAVRKDVKNPEALMYLLNESMDSLYRSDKKTIEAMNKIGYTFKYPFTPYEAPLNMDDPDRITDTHNYEVEGWGYFNRANYHTKFMYGFQLSDPAAFVNYLQQLSDLHTGKLTKDQVDGNIVTDYDSLNQEPRKAASFSDMFEYWVKFSSTDALQVNELVGSPTPAAVAKKALLDTMEKEVFAQIIMGTKPITAFDQFVTDWKKNGGDEWTKEANDWYMTTK